MELKINGTKSITKESIDKKSINQELKNKKVESSTTPVDGLPSAASLDENEVLYVRIVAAFPWRLIGEMYSILCDEQHMGTKRHSHNKAVKIRKKLIGKGYL